MISKTPEPPYYAVIFTSLRTDGDEGYAAMSEKMLQLASRAKGFLGAEWARNELGITVSYWESLEAIKCWKNDVQHTVARKLGKEKWYKAFRVRVAKVEREYGFDG
ncbi:antibiotic biosynthesis monooxygenase [Prolixibacteraceae bacterium Z1-6]|uniref:Antibiotic biosynthesis monooxygenase n=1 Tax=Draconibacterium aestuarii TaxID=2998507 RepID=A0A9X3F2X3_9BACT|nr:antibiotic biosynthesis monooxygenase [Prolixibacteraceae bacterium Z1-6]